MDENFESKLPDQWMKEITGKEHDEAATRLSTHRTAMSTHRTELSTHRTYLSTARSHMANERTHLSYLRTSLSLMSFGITLNRFSVFLRQNKAVPYAYGLLAETAVVGLGMVLLGIIILTWGLFRFRKASEQIQNDTYTSSQKAMTILTISVLILGGLTTIWMFIRSGQ